MTDTPTPQRIAYTDTHAELADVKSERDELLRQVQALQNDKTALTARLNEACAEIAQWKTECLERRQIMIRAQKEAMLRVPIMGVVK